MSKGIAVSSRAVAPEHDVLRLLSDGYPARARDALRADGLSDWFVRIAEVDAGVRDFTATVHEVQALRDEVAAADDVDDPLRYWADAMCVERLLLQGDPVAFILATNLLREIDDELLPPLITLYARARLRRAVAWGWCFFPDGDTAEAYRTRRDAAVADLHRAGFMKEAAFTRGASAAIRALATDEELVEAFDVLGETLRVIDDDAADPSQLGVLLRSFLTVVAYEVGEYDVGLAASRLVTRTLPAGSPVHFLHDYQSAVLRFLHEPEHERGIGPIEALLDAHTRAAPHETLATYAHFAQILLDLGHPEGPRLARLALDQMMPVPSWAAFRVALGVRLRLAEGVAVPLEEVLAPLEDLSAVGRGRTAARMALRIAGDRSQQGAGEDARRLADWGLAAMPAGVRLSCNEHVWLARVGDAGTRGPTPSTDAGISIRVLRPTVQVTTRNQPVALTETPLRLLLALAVSYPAPLHVESAGDLLWPEEPLARCRQRLNTIVYRLRRSLGGVDAIVRQGDLVSLDESVCAIDLVGYRRALNGSIEQRLTALTSVEGALCIRQFPFDEVLIEQSHQFVADWTVRARELVAGGASPAVFADALRALDLDPADLT